MTLKIAAFADIDEPMLASPIGTALSRYSRTRCFLLMALFDEVYGERQLSDVFYGREKRVELLNPSAAMVSDINLKYVAELDPWCRDFVESGSQRLPHLRGDEVSCDLEELISSYLFSDAVVDQFNRPSLEAGWLASMIEVGLAGYLVNGEVPSRCKLFRDFERRAGELGEQSDTEHAETMQQAFLDENCRARQYQARLVLNTILAIVIWGFEGRLSELIVESISNVRRLLQLFVTDHCVLDCINCPWKPLMVAAVWLAEFAAGGEADVDTILGEYRLDPTERDQADFEIRKLELRLKRETQTYSQNVDREQDPQRYLKALMRNISLNIRDPETALQFARRVELLP